MKRKQIDKVRNMSRTQMLREITERANKAAQFLWQRDAIDDSEKGELVHLGGTSFLLAQVGIDWPATPPVERLSTQEEIEAFSFVYQHFHVSWPLIFPVDIHNFQSYVAALNSTLAGAFPFVGPEVSE